MNKLRVRLRKGRTLAVVAVVLVVATTSTVAATDNKAMPGTACQPIGEGLGLQYGFTWIENANATTDANVLCPLQSDTMSSDEPLDLEIYVYDQHSSKSVACRLYIANATSTTYTSGSLAVSSAAGVGNYTLSPSIPSVAYGNDSVWTVLCTLPDTDTGTSQIKGYWWDE